MKENYNKVLIISPNPFSESSTARTLKTFFYGWDKNCIAQIYFNSIEPCDGFCTNYYQVTDLAMLRRRLKKIQTGKIYNSSYQNKISQSSVKYDSYKSLHNILYKIGRKKTPFIHLFRNYIWNKKYWKTDLLEEWVNNFNPDIIFFDLIDDNYGCEIALYFSKKRNIPILSFICDDYYFNDVNGVWPFYHMYRRKYKELAEKIILASISRIYVCDMIKEKYSTYFKNEGIVIYTTSEIRPADSRNDNVTPIISYLGNLSLGRWKSLIDIGEALQKVYPTLSVNIYSYEKDETILNRLKNARGITFHGSVPYAEVERIMKNSDIVLQVENSELKNVIKTRYSLSTKIADCLSCGSCLLAYGPPNIGSIDYLIKNNCAYVVNSKNDLPKMLHNIINDKNLRKEYVNKALEISKTNHDVINNSSKFKNLINNVLRG